MTGNRFIIFLLAAGALAAAALMAMPVESYDALGWGDMAGPAQAADPTVPAAAPQPPAAHTAESGDHAEMPRLWLR
jgi:hypothetical protein